jgi:hypothetical protein
MIYSVESAACNNFPKIFGGSLDRTYLLHIDIFNDYLVLAGDTYDSSLMGTSLSAFTFVGIPYLALTSISTGGKYYWAKAWTSKSYENIFGV